MVIVSVILRNYFLNLLGVQKIAYILNLFQFLWHIFSPGLRVTNKQLLVVTSSKGKSVIIIRLRTKAEREGTSS